MQGTFCVDDDSTAPSNTATSCDDGGTYTESHLRLRVAPSSEPSGVVQQVGSKARFGLMEFKGAGDGGRVLVGSFSCSPSPCVGSNKVGPIVAAPTVARDDANMTWVFFSTGRYYSASDKTNADTQYFIDVKDPVIPSLCTQSTTTNCERNDLRNVSAATVCSVCTGSTTQVTGVSGVDTLLGDTTTTLQGLIKTKDGWYTILPKARERDVVSPTLVGGSIFFPTFVPQNDVCSSTGDGYLYALFYLTGSAYMEPIIGVEAAGSNTNVRKVMDLSVGLSSQMVVHIGAQETDTTTGVTGRIKVCSQSSTGALACTKTNPPLASWSRPLSWNDLRT